MPVKENIIMYILHTNSIRLRFDERNAMQWCWPHGNASFQFRIGLAPCWLWFDWTVAMVEYATVNQNGFSADKIIRSDNEVG